MSDYNRVILCGRLGKDAELRYTQGGSPVSTLNLATSESWTKDGERQQRTEWHRIVLWGKTAENLQDYLLKGKQILVEGSLHTRKWQDKDGNDKYTTEVKAFKIVLLGGGKREKDGETAETPTEGSASGDGAHLSDDDIPF